MKYLNLIHYPFRLLFLPFVALVCFFMTDWGDKVDRKFYKEVLISLVKPV